MRWLMLGRDIVDTLVIVAIVAVASAVVGPSDLG